VNDTRGSKGIPLAMTRDVAPQRGEDPDTAWRPSKEGPESERRRKALIANV